MEHKHKIAKSIASANHICVLWDMMITVDRVFNTGKPKIYGHYLVETEKMLRWCFGDNHTNEVISKLKDYVSDKYQPHYNAFNTKTDFNKK